MTNSRLKTFPPRNVARLQPEAVSDLGPGCAHDDGPTAEEGLRLLMAFIRIHDPGRRAWLLEQVERLADLKSTMQ
jgi:hypothetical protein